jgi:hypothetical protein
MTKTFGDLPGWSFSVEEVSAGVYEIVGVHETGRRVEAKGTDYDGLLSDCRHRAAQVSAVQKQRDNA